MKDKECRKEVKLLFEKIGHKKLEWYKANGEFQCEMHESTGIMRCLVSLNDKIEALEKFLGVELVTDSLFEYRKIKDDNARPNPSKS